MQIDNLLLVLTPIFTGLIALLMSEHFFTDSKAGNFTSSAMLSFFTVVLSMVTLNLDILGYKVEIWGGVIVKVISLYMFNLLIISGLMIMSAFLACTEIKDGLKACAIAPIFIIAIAVTGHAALLEELVAHVYGTVEG